MIEFLTILFIGSFLFACCMFGLFLLVSAVILVYAFILGIVTACIPTKEN